MDRLHRLEKNGWTILNFINEKGVQASRNNGLKKVKGNSVTDLHFKIFGY
tara:strand:+ start:543 stop:692 length:150 start_codon:yes stop_codon:yes gene_type:complete